MCTLQKNQLSEDNYIGELKQAEKLVIGDFVLVKFTTETQIIYNVGRIATVYSFSEYFYSHKGDKRIPLDDIYAVEKTYQPNYYVLQIFVEPKYCKVTYQLLLRSSKIST